MRILAKLYSALFMLLSIAALSALIAAAVIIKRGQMGAVILLTPHFWLFIAVYAFLPILFCLGLSLRSRAALRSRFYLAAGMICLLPWMVGISGMVMTMPLIAPRVEQHVLQMDIINRVAQKFGTTQQAPSQPADQPAPQ